MTSMIDQLVVGGIKNTLSSTACAEVLGKNVAKDVWDTLETLFHQQTLSRADILHDTLLHTYKNDMSIEAYLAKIKGIANRHTPISFTELRARLLVHEQELERIRGRATPPILGQYPTHPSPPPADFSNKSFSNSLHHGKPQFSTGYNAGNCSQFGKSCYRGHCQICKQEGHSASKCTYRYIRPDSHNNDNLSTPFAGIHVPDSQSPAENSPDCVSPLWLGDTGATNHMASHADLVQQPLRFNGPSGVYVGNDDSLRISHIGNSSINLGNNSLSLKDILVVPQLKENLVSIAKLTKDNNCVFACFPWGYVIKDLATGVILLKGPVKDNLYPIPAHALSTAFRTFSYNNATFVAHTAKAASVPHGTAGLDILLPLAIAFEPTLLSHSSPTSNHSNASTTASRVQLPSPATQSSSPAVVLPLTTSTICAPLDQFAIPLPTSAPAPLISNHHPMTTRAKSGIRKPRALCARLCIMTINT
ncbi:hypothetical protein POTOM_048829 [Populus tomentosa]|uniref:Retrovirus-related Pol polyprotein from transposon TNT 1-94-like beta-barrel domain-containing protein n=1 Tax=Populus tomentosa TaxID=118781 RepID=A0A8X7YDL7_POPTO|nr:hypothetical protein POTOM_048829 [Populus tomentosa]